MFLTRAPTMKLIACVLFPLCQTGKDNTHLSAKQGVRKKYDNQMEIFEKKSKKPYKTIMWNCNY